MKDKDIVWSKENTQKFGLSHPTFTGKFNDFKFFIFYDYDGKSDEKPENCGMFALIFYKEIKLDRKYSYDSSTLMFLCYNFLSDLKKQFENANF